MKTASYIIRKSANANSVIPGMVRESFVSTDRIPKHSARQVRVWRKDAPWQAEWVRRDALLPEHQAFRREPVEDFWFIAIADAFFGHKNCPHFVTDAHSTDGSIGPNAPWRFESKGEAVYFLRTRKLSRKKFIICHYEKSRSQDL